MISEEALQIARDSRDTRRESLALLFLADAEFQQGAFRESDAHYAELVATHRRRNAPPRDLGHALFSHAWILSALGRTREAKAAIDEALDIHRTLGERVTVAYALLVRAEVYGQWGDWESALRDLAEARSIGEAVDLPADDLTAHANLVEARLELARGRFDRASRILEDLRSSSSQTPATQVVAGSLAASCEAMLGLRQASTAGSLAHRAIDTPTAMEIDRIRAAVCLSEAQRRMGAGDLEDRVRALLDSRQLDQIPWLLARTAATAVQIPAFARERERVRDLGMEAMEAYWSLAPEDRRTAIRERPDVVTVLEILEREDE